MENGPKRPPGDHWRALDAVLRTDARDPGCDVVREQLDVVAELSVRGGATAQLPGGVGAHLGSCGNCREDLAGLVELLPDGPRR